MTRTSRHCEGFSPWQSQSSLRGLVQAVAIYFTTIDPHVAVAPRDDVVFKVMARTLDADSDFPFVPFVSYVPLVSFFIFSFP